MSVPMRIEQAPLAIGYQPLLPFSTVTPSSPYQLAANATVTLLYEVSLQTVNEAAAGDGRTRMKSTANATTVRKPVFTMYPLYGKVRRIALVP